MKNFILVPVLLALVSCSSFRFLKGQDIKQALGNPHLYDGRIVQIDNCRIVQKNTGDTATMVATFSINKEELAFSLMIEAQDQTAGETKEYVLIEYPTIMRLEGLESEVEKILLNVIHNKKANLIFLTFGRPSTIKPSVHLKGEISLEELGKILLGHIKKYKLGEGI